MSKVKILTDSCSDLTEDLLTKYDIDYMKMNTVWGNEEIPASLTWEYFTPKKLYDTMREGIRITTTQVPTEEINKKFTEYLDKGFDIIYIGCSLKQSGSVNAATVVAEELLKGYPDRKIYCIDSLRACVGEGLLAIYASELVQQGLSTDEIAEKVKAKRLFVNQFATVHTLDYLKRAGRVKAASAFFGNLMGIKPIIVADFYGDQLAYKKVKGRMNAINECVRLMKEAVGDEEKQTIYLCHADCSEAEIEKTKKAITDNIPCTDIHTSFIGPIIGASVGPDTIAIYAFGSEVKEDMK